MQRNACGLCLHAVITRQCIRPAWCVWFPFLHRHIEIEIACLRLTFYLHLIITQLALINVLNGEHNQRIAYLFLYFSNPFRNEKLGSIIWNAIDNSYLQQPNWIFVNWQTNEGKTTSSKEITRMSHWQVSTRSELQLDKNLSLQNKIEWIASHLFIRSLALSTHISNYSICLLYCPKIALVVELFFQYAQKACVCVCVWWKRVTVT